MPLNLTDFNQFYVINKICGQEKQRHYLESLGFVPGARISILSELHGYYLVMVKGSKIGLDHRAFALLIILTLLGCASALTLTDYLKSLIRRSGFDVAGVHDKKSLKEMFHLLKRTDKWIVCEGVETKEMVDFLIAEECDELQGFYYYKPMEQKKFEELID